MTMPNFLIIGAGRSGTTSLYNYLGQHPQIYLSPIKEPRFFAYENESPAFCGPGDQAKSPQITSLTDYQRLFLGAQREKSLGEASPIYLYSKKAPVRIQHYVPDIKLIAILRQPVDRAYSRFWANRVRGVEPLADFEQAMQVEEMRIQNNWHPHWHYKQRGLYYKQLKRYFDLFEPHQIQVYLYQDLVANPRALMHNLCLFLDIDEKQPIDISNVSHEARVLPKNRALYAFFTQSSMVKAFARSFMTDKWRRWFMQKFRVLTAIPRPPLSPELQSTLNDDYRNDILHLEALIRRDLSLWLT